MLGIRAVVLGVALALPGASVRAQLDPTLPAVFYEVEAREILGFGRAMMTPRNGGVNIATSSGRLNSIGKERERMFVGEEFVGAANFTVTPDTIFWRAGPNDFRIPVRSVARVDEVSRADGYGVMWAKIVYRVGEDERALFVRRVGVQQPTDLLAALRLAVDRANAGS